MSDIDALKSQIDAIGDITTASGKYTTAAWALGTNTCEWTAPAAGTYIIIMVYEYVSGTKQDYIQLHMRGNGTFGGAGASTGVFYYTENAGKNFNVCEIIGISKFTAAVDSGMIPEAEFIHPLPGKQYGYMELILFAINNRGC